MRLFTKEELLIFTTKLQGDLYYVQWWVIDYMGQWRPERIMEFIRIWQHWETFPLMKPLLLINPPKINGKWEVRELADFIDEILKEKREYLDRVWFRLSKQLKAFLLTGEVFYKPKEEKPTDDKFVWTKVPIRTKFWLDLLFGDDADDEKPP